MKKCPICNGTNIVKLTNDQKICGLVEIVAPATVNIQNLIPVHVFCCKDCGHVELQHISPKSIVKE